MEWHLERWMVVVLATCLVFANVVSSEESFADTPILKRPKACNKYRTLLSLDGGGMKGMITTMVLQEISTTIKEFYLSNSWVLTKHDKDTRLVTLLDFDINLSDHFDLISGISAGSWMATYLATNGGMIPLDDKDKNISDSVRPAASSQTIFDLKHIKRKFGSIRAGNPRGLEVFFLEYGTYIYPPQFVPLILQPRLFALPKAKFDQLTVPQYTPGGLEWVLERFLGDVTLNQASTSLLIAAFDLNQRSAIQFVADMHNNTNVTYTNVVWTTSKPLPKEPDESSDIQGSLRSIKELNYYIRDLTRASSAFPMVHGAKQVKPLEDIRHEFNLIDGAMVGNNPILQSMMWMIQHMDCELDNIAAISIGTGTVVGDYTKAGTGGVVQWGGPLISLLLDSSTEFIQSNVDFLVYGTLYKTVDANQYLRIQVEGDQGTRLGDCLGAIDDTLSLPYLKSVGRGLAIEYQSNIQAFVKNFMFYTNNTGECVPDS